MSHKYKKSLSLNKNIYCPRSCFYWDSPLLSLQRRRLWCARLVRAASWSGPSTEHPVLIQEENLTADLSERPERTTFPSYCDSHLRTRCAPRRDKTSGAHCRKSAAHFAGATLERGCRGNAGSRWGGTCGLSWVNSGIGKYPYGGSECKACWIRKVFGLFDRAKVLFAVPVSDLEWVRPYYRTLWAIFKMNQIRTVR